mmetsp:Transcript_10140/g.31511  ORF Transcript_10140/g.31511 Transcript_10140/m.31511 type:complete len:328 (-) Transcript_10140:986-1969(-)
MHEVQRQPGPGPDGAAGRGDAQPGDVRLHAQEQHHRGLRGEVGAQLQHAEPGHGPPAPVPRRLRGRLPADACVHRGVPQGRGQPDGGPRHGPRAGRQERPLPRHRLLPVPGGLLEDRIRDGLRHVRPGGRHCHLDALLRQDLRGLLSRACDGPGRRNANAGRHRQRLRRPGARCGHALPPQPLGRATRPGRLRDDRRVGELAADGELRAARCGASRGDRGGRRRPGELRAGAHRRGGQRLCVDDGGAGRPACVGRVRPGGQVRGRQERDPGHRGQRHRLDVLPRDILQLQRNPGALPAPHVHDCGLRLQQVLRRARGQRRSLAGLLL